MKERPILMSAPMVRALLSGTKTQTRRVVAKQPNQMVVEGARFVDGLWAWLSGHDGSIVEKVLGTGSCPYGKPGDRLWVREAHAFSVVDPEGLDWHDDPDNWDLIYRADEHQPGGGWRDGDGKPMAAPWRASIHMPRWASRITLEITEVRVQRLQDITEADCRAEGCCGGPGSIQGYLYSATPQEHFKHLWESINPDEVPLLDDDGRRIGNQLNPARWDANPWVWALSFRRIEGGT